MSWLPPTSRRACSASTRVPIKNFPKHPSVRSTEEMASYARLGAGQVCQLCKPQTLTVTSLSMQTSAFLQLRLLGIFWSSFWDAILAKSDQVGMQTSNLTVTSVFMQTFADLPSYSLSFCRFGHLFGTLCACHISQNT